MRRTKTFKRMGAVAATALAAASLLAACGSSSDGTTGGGEGGTLHAVASAFPDYLDPALSHTEEGWTATWDTYIPLLTYAHKSGAAGSQVIPGLATAMPEVSDGGRTYTLTLRKGLHYSDGTPVRASDFPASLERVFLLNSSGSFFYEDIVGADEFMKTKKGGISGIEADDASGKIVIHLTEPRGTFDNELALPFASLLPKGTPAKDLSADPPPAVGPYEIVKSQPGRGWEYGRNPQWAKTNAKLLPQIPDGNMDRIQFQVIRNPDTEVNGIQQGHYDFMLNVPPADRYQEVKEKFEGSQFRVEPAVSTYFFWMNTTKAPFSDVRIRQAVNMALDPRALERIYVGQLNPGQQILPPGMPGHEKLDLYPTNLAKAKELVAQANPSDRTVTVWTESGETSRDAGAYYQDVLNKLGFDASLKVLQPDNYFTVIGNSSTPDLDTGWANWFEDYPHPNDFFQPLLAEESIAPTNGTNLARFADPKLSKKITELGEQQLGPQQEKEYAALDREFMEQAPLAPYGSGVSTTFVSDAVDLEDVIFNPTFGQDLASFRFK